MFTTNHSQKNLFCMLTLMLCVFALVAMFVFTTSTTAYCADEDVGDTIQTAFSALTGKIYNIMRSIIIPCCIIALGFAGFQFIAGGSKGPENARKVVISVLCAVCFVVMAPLAAKTIAGLVKDNGTDDWDNYNPLS